MCGYLNDLGYRLDVTFMSDYMTMCYMEKVMCYEIMIKLARHTCDAKRDTSSLMSSHDTFTCAIYNLTDQNVACGQDVSFEHYVSL